MPTLDEALRQLAAVSPTAFTRERDALAKALRESGDAKAAADVKKRRAPTLPVWIVNRLALEHADDLDAYLDAADRVRSAQLGRSGTLSSASAAHRAALERLRSRADAMLRAATIAASPDKLARIQNTLAGAAADPEARKALRAGLVERELMAPGFDAFGGAESLPTRPSTAEEAPAEDERTDRSESAADRRKRQREAEREAAARRREVQEAAHRERIERARAALHESQALAKTAHERASEAAARLRDALEQVEQARAAVSEANADAHRRDAEVARARAALDAAERAAT